MGIFINLTRRNEAGNLIHELDYRYDGKAVGEAVGLNNKLKEVINGVGANFGDYHYDAIGNLIEDNSSEEDLTIEWTIYGKIKKVTQTKSGQTTTIEYKYDAGGNRILKRVTTAGTTTDTHYVLDAAGNSMAVYTNTVLKEQGIYGSSRLGLYNHSPQEDTEGNTIDNSNKHQLGQRYYELSNHLNNVLTVITDNKIPKEGTVLDEIAEEYHALVLSATDYLPFWA